MKTLFDYNILSVKYRYKLNKKSKKELLELLVISERKAKDDTAHWFRSSKTGKYATLYNEVGVMIATNVELNDRMLATLRPVHTHKQFNFASMDYNNSRQYVVNRLAVLMGLKVFQNGNMPNESKCKFDAMMKIGREIF